MTEDPKYLKKVCVECSLIIHSELDQEKIRSLSGSSEYYHKDCLETYEKSVEADRKAKGRGRPPKITPEVMTKLEFAFSANCNNTEACLYAGICTRTLDRYLEEHEEFSQRIDELRSNPRMTAKLNQKKELEKGNVNTSEFILKHTDEEYKTRTSTEHSGTVGMTLLEQIIDDEGKG